jgi:hypothetical protein
LSKNSDFFFNIKTWPLQLDWHRFQSTKPTLAPVWPIFVGFQRLVNHLDENCLTNLNLFSKTKLDYCSSNCDDFSELGCVYNMTFSLGGGRWYYNGPQPTALGIIWPSLCHQNRRFSTNFVLFARTQGHRIRGVARGPSGRGLRCYSI